MSSIHESFFSIRRLAEQPHLPAEPIWESKQTNKQGKPLLTLFREKKFFLQIACQGKGVFGFDQTSTTIDVFWENSTPPFDHYLRTLGLGFYFEVRGIPSFHGNILSWRNKAFGLVGTSTMGKSTLSMALRRNGCRLLSDDYLAPRSTGETSWRISPTSSECRLWPDSLHYFFEADDIAAFPKVYPSYEKRSVRDQNLERLDANEQIDIGALYILERHQDSGRDICEIATLSLGNAFLALLNDSLIADAAPAMGIEEKRFKTLAKFICDLPIKRISYRSGYEFLPEICNRLMQDFDGVLLQPSPMGIEPALNDKGA